MPPSAGYAANVRLLNAEAAADGGRALAYQIVETGQIDPANDDDRWEVELPIAPGSRARVQWFESVLVNGGSGGATTIRPELGREDGWVVDEFGHVSQAAGADSYHNIPSEIPFVVADAQALYGRSRPDLDTASGGRIITTVLVILG